jgi:hypothetical protein
MPVAALFIQGVHRFMLSSDGLINVSCSAFEGESIAAGRHWLEGIGKDLWVVGPLENAPPAAKGEPDEELPPMTADDAQVLAFLDRMHAKTGDRSTLFVSYAKLVHRLRTLTFPPVRLHSEAHTIRRIPQSFMQFSPNCLTWRCRSSGRTRLRSPLCRLNWPSGLTQARARTTRAGSRRWLCSRILPPAGS